MEFTKPGVRNIVIGIGLFLLGLAITAATYFAASDDGTFIFAWGPMLVGGLQFIWGCFQFLIFSLKGESGQAEHFAKMEIRAVLRAMVYQAKADNNFDIAELRLIQKLFFEYTGIELDSELLHSMADEVSDPRYSFDDDIRSIRGQISFNTKVTIIKMLYLVSAVDGTVKDEEVVAIYGVARTLNVHEADVLPIIEEVQTAFYEQSKNETVSEKPKKATTKKNVSKRRRKAKLIQG